MKYVVNVELDVDPKGYANVMVYQSMIDNEPKLSFREISHVLVGGMSLLVKLVNKTGEMKDHELMEEIIHHLNQEFISIKNFSDAEIIKLEK